MVARIFEDFEINSPSNNDIKNKILILYHITFHRVRLIMIRNILIFLIYHVGDNILHIDICVCVKCAEYVPESWSGVVEVRLACRGNSPILVFCFLA